MVETYQRASELPAPAEEAFGWHEREGALERLIPPWEKVRVVERSGGIRDGARVVLEMRVGPMKLHWIAEHRDYDPPRSFTDVQAKGPFAAWEHRHRIEALDAERSRLVDEIRYALPAGPLGALLGGPMARSRLESTFRYRHDTTRADLAMHRRFSGAPRLRVLMSGGTGLVGQTARAMLETGGHGVVVLTRSAARARQEGFAHWDPSSGISDPEGLGRFDAVVHLAGENIASGRWSDEQKRRIRKSRVEGTRALVRSLGALPSPPATFLCSSAVGWYGPRGDERLDESEPAGDGFLAEVCAEWEAEAERARELGARVALLRFGPVLSPRGGMLDKLLTPFSLGAGGPVGSGDQWVSWVAIDDVGAAIHEALMRPELAGPLNVTAPEPVTNRELARTLGRVLRRPAIAPLPAFAARLAFGEMADEMLLGGQRVVPSKLEAAGFAFRYRRLEDALRHLLGR